MASYVTGAGPHIRLTTSVPQRCWVTAAALLPLCMAGIYFSGWPALRVLGSAVSAALLAEWLAKKIFQKPLTLYDGHSLLIGLLLGCLCPLSMPAWMVALGCGFGILVGKELFGGLGQYVFHPALVGQAFLYVSFPHYFQSTATLAGLMQGSYICAAMLLLGALFLFMRRFFYWEIPWLFIATLGIGALLRGADLAAAVLSSGAFFAAFFILPEPEAMPGTRVGARFYAVTAGALLACFLSEQRYLLPFVLLVMNALTPWLDARLRPRQATRVSERL